MHHPRAHLSSQTTACPCTHEPLRCEPGAHTAAGCVFQSGAPKAASVTQGEEQPRAQAQCNHNLAALHRMAERASALDRELEPDNAFTCRLTMEVTGRFSYWLLAALPSLAVSA